MFKHKYHRHWNHGRPQVGFWGILGVLSIEPLSGGEGLAGGLYRPPPPPGNENPASPAETGTAICPGPAGNFAKRGQTCHGTRAEEGEGHRPKHET